ncbi:MAG TPA: F0F1 ATP synthase subunit B [Vicinamibacterales bacterium]|nr:F0F1 ATP synthase subunit B [Vicinamibacterales bacterium]
MQQLAQTFGVDWPHLIAQVVSFSIVCALLYRLAYTPVLAMLARRRELIAQGLVNTEKINAALAAIEVRREQTLSAARDEAASIVEQARTLGRRMHEQETDKAVAAANRILLRARAQAAAERTQLMATARRDLGRLVVETTAAVAGRVLTEDDQRRLAEETTRQLKAA